MSPVRLAVCGFGAMGRRHAEAISASESAALSAVVDSVRPTLVEAEQRYARGYPDFDSLLAADRPDGVILATPSALHARQGAAAIDAGIPVLIEKPVATTAAEAERLVAHAESAGVPLAVGHHRRHNPIIAAAKGMLDEGRLGRIVAAHGFAWLMKPEQYFALSWRRRFGGGPLLINLIHDIDLMRHLCGEIVEARALTGHAARGFEVEDSAAVALRFESGALGTLALSDSAVAPWSWELTAAENPLYPETGQSCYQIAGTEGALEIPRLRLWRNPASKGWDQPLNSGTTEIVGADPLVRQIDQFAQVIRGEAAPLVTGRDGLAAMRVLDAIRDSAETGYRAVPGREGGEG